MNKTGKVMVAIVIAAAIHLGALWAQQKPALIMQDGKPVVMERKPAPRTSYGKPDFSGIWTVPSTDENKLLQERFGQAERFGAVGRPELTPWAAERFEYNRDPRPGSQPEGFPPGTFGARPELNPFFKCFPAGTAFLITGWGSISSHEIIQSPKRVLMFYEYDHTIRQIWTDGRKHPDPVDPSWVGHSIGTWEGDTLVVDTVGLKNEVWLDGQGHVASPALRIIERYQRIDNDTLQIDLTYEDPKAFKKPWTRRMYRRLRPTWEINEGDVRCYPGSPDRRAQEENFDQMFTEP